MTAEPLPDPPPLPDGEMSLVSSELLIVGSCRADAVAGFSFDEAGEQLVVQCTFEGRRNQTTERAQVTVALSPEDAIHLVSHLVVALDLIDRRARSQRDKRRRS